MSAAPKVIYLTGWGRSGSTVLNRLLVGEQVVAVGELRLLWERGVLDHQDCSCGFGWEECTLWHPVVRSVLEKRAAADPVAAARHFDELGRKAGRAIARRPHHLGAASREYAAVLGDVYRSIAEQTHARVIVDSSKNPAHAMLARAAGMDVTVVHLVRDPRAVVWSHQRVKAPPPGTAANITEQHGPVYVATRWALRNSFIDRNVEPELRIRYEDMVAESERVTKTIFTTAGMDVPPPSGGVEHLIAGNPNRFEPVGSKRLHVDDEWRHAQPASQKRLIKLVAGRVMRRYSYE